MSRPFLELPEAANRTIKSLRIYDDPPYGREVHIVFTDGTQISIDLETSTKVKARHYRSASSGDLGSPSARRPGRRGSDCLESAMQMMGIMKPIPTFAQPRRLAG